MLPRPQSVDDGKKETIFEYKNSSIENIIDGVEDYFTGRYYRLESGQPDHGVYGRGNDLARFLLGALVKRFKISVAIEESDGGQTVLLFLGKAMSGAMGGVFGHHAMTKEYNAVVEELSEGFDEEE